MLMSRGSGSQSTDYAATIRRAFQHDGLQGAVDALPLERRFKLSNVKDVRPSAAPRRLLAAFCIKAGPQADCLDAAQAVGAA